MSNNNNNNSQKQNGKDGITSNIKDSAGAVFHATHKALEATENVAMGAVDQTSKAINSMTGNNENRRNQQK